MGQRRSGPVRAAGGVVWRVRAGRPQVAIVHRPRYDDWSLPKGKLESGESELAAAVREVGEELGSRVAVGRRLSRISYDYDDVHKTVAFWSMRHVGGAFEANDEVDEVQWVSPKAAAAHLSYDIERGVMDEFTDLPIADSTVVLVRHAKAGKRTEWRGDDHERPLENTGRSQADRLIGFLGHFAPDRMVSAPPVRCVQTVAPAAAATGLEVTIEPVFSDDGYEQNPQAAQNALLALAKPGRVTAICSQGRTIPSLVELLAPSVRRSDTRKGAAWVLSIVDGTVVAADYYPDAAR